MAVLGQYRVTGALATWCDDLISRIAYDIASRCVAGTIPTIS